MTTPSLHDQTGISVHTSPAIWKASAGTYSITADLSGLSITKNAIGGYGQANVQMTANTNVLYDWLADGLGRDILIVDGDGVPVYNGFTNRVAINLGGVSVTRGPLLSTANRVSVMYVPIIDETTEPPVLGTRTETTIAESLPSQAKYGIVEKVLSTGNALDADAESVRDTYLEEYKEPEVSQQIGLGGGGQLEMSIECAGYFEWLDVLAYNDITTPLSVELTTKILSLLTAEQAANGIFSTNVSHVGWNAVLTSSYESENRTAMAIIKGILAHGGGSDERWLIGVYDNRMVYYNAMPVNAEYQHRIHGQTQVVQRLDNSTVQPWSVLPGKWIFMPDLLPGWTREGNDLHADPRALFIETVTYTAPYGLQLTGSKVGTLSQKMSKLGLGGVG